MFNSRELAVTIVDMLGTAIARIEISDKETLKETIKGIEEYFRYDEDETRELKADLIKFLNLQLNEREDNA